MINHCYRSFLIDNSDPEEREYAEPEDQIREVLIHSNYLSQKYIEVCVAFDPGELVDYRRYKIICDLHDSFISKWGSINT